MGIFLQSLEKNSWNTWCNSFQLSPCFPVRSDMSYDIVNKKPNVFTLTYSSRLHQSMLVIRHNFWQHEWINIVLGERDHFFQNWISGTNLFFHDCNLSEKECFINVFEMLLRLCKSCYGLKQISCGFWCFKILFIFISWHLSNKVFTFQN